MLDNLWNFSRKQLTVVVSLTYSLDVVSPYDISYGTGCEGEVSEVVSWSGRLGNQ